MFESVSLQVKKKIFEKVCPKCGSTDISKTFWPHGSAVDFYKCGKCRYEGFMIIEKAK